MIWVLRNSCFVEKRPSHYIFSWWQHLLINTFVYHVKFILCALDDISYVWKVTRSEETIKRSMLFDVYSCVFWINDRFYVKFLDTCIDIWSWLRITKIFEKIWGREPFFNAISWTHEEKFMILLILCTLIEMKFAQRIFLLIVHLNFLKMRNPWNMAQFLWI